LLLIICTITQIKPFCPRWKDIFQRIGLLPKARIALAATKVSQMMVLLLKLRERDPELKLILFYEGEWRVWGIAGLQ
jgi:hypothetical protein